MSETDYRDSKRFKHLERMIERAEKFPITRLSEEQVADFMGIPETGTTDSIIDAVHTDGDDHDTENFRGCTHPDCKELKRILARGKHLEHMIECHMNVIDKLNAHIKELGKEVRAGDEAVSESQKQTTHLIKCNEVLLDTIDKQVANITELEAKIERIRVELDSGECEHEWQTSPHDAGMAFCRLCGIEHS